VQTVPRRCLQEGKPPRLPDDLLVRILGRLADGGNGEDLIVRVVRLVRVKREGVVASGDLHGDVLVAGVGHEQGDRATGARCSPSVAASASAWFLAVELGVGQERERISRGVSIGLAATASLLTALGEDVADLGGRNIETGQNRHAGTATLAGGVTTIALVLVAIPLSALDGVGLVAESDGVREVGDKELVRSRLGRIKASSSNNDHQQSHQRNNSLHR